MSPLTPKESDEFFQNLAQATKFAAVLGENFQGVRYDPKKMAGTASIPNVGVIDFREAANDPAVIVQLNFAKRFKGDAEAAIRFLEALQEAWSNSD